MAEQYDSTPDTLLHIKRVNELLLMVISELLVRASVHDNSKLEEPEKGIFDVVTPELKGLTYGSEAYKASLGKMKVALDHHYANNTHHPEHFQNGVDGMNLLDVLEMLVDWKAATERHADGDIRKSLQINKERFKLSDQLVNILSNTISDLSW